MRDFIITVGLLLSAVLLVSCGGERQNTKKADVIIELPKEQAKLKKHMKVSFVMFGRVDTAKHYKGVQFIKNYYRSNPEARKLIPDK